MTSNRTILTPSGGTTEHERVVDENARISAELAALETALRTCDASIRTLFSLPLGEDASRRIRIALSPARRAISAALGDQSGFLAACKLEAAREQADANEEETLKPCADCGGDVRNDRVYVGVKG